MEYSVAMKRFIFSTIIALAGLSVLGAQTDAETKKPETKFEYEAIRKGDQFIRLSLGLNIPLFYLTPDGVESDTNLNLGGAGCIGYSRFLTSRISLGGELGFGFDSTIGDNMFLYVPIVVKTTYEAVYGRFHFPLSLGLGLAIQTYDNDNFYGPIIRPEVACFFQYSPSWSFGISSCWDIIPQWYDDSDANRTGNILNVTAGLRYHF